MMSAGDGVGISSSVTDGNRAGPTRRTIRLLTGKFKIRDGKTHCARPIKELASDELLPV
jgi:hypothetical protein